MAEQKSSPILDSLRFPDWRHAYESALLETDDRTLFKQIEIAEAIILTRRDALAQSPDHHAEQQAMEHALFNLRILKKDRLKFAVNNRTAHRS